MRAWPVYDGLQSSHLWGGGQAQQAIGHLPVIAFSATQVLRDPIRKNQAYVPTETECPRPLADYWAAWRRLPDISRWVLRTVRHGYTIQFRKGPPPFSRVLPTTVRPGEASILSQEIVSLLEKGAIEEILPTQMESGFYSRYFVVPKKDGGFRPILDLRRLNLVLRVSKFKMLMVKSILSQVQSEDWFVTIDLKDAYFHIPIVKRHRKFLRFAFEGKAYQYCVLPIGLALAPRTFTKCMDASLAPLRLQGIRILNYLDDWLILAQSQDQARIHRDLSSPYPRSLELRSGPALETESAGWGMEITPPSGGSFMAEVRVTPRERGYRGDTPHSDGVRLLQPVQSEDWFVTIDLKDAYFHIPIVKRHRKFLRLLGLMAAASPVVQLGLLHMRPFQWWTKSQNISQHSHPLRRITTVTMDASLTGWGAVHQRRPVGGVWTEVHRGWHINRLEMLAVLLALKQFLPQLRGYHVLVRTDNTAVVSYLNRQEGLRSRLLYRLTRRVLLWAQTKLLSIRAVHIPDRLNSGADLLSRQSLQDGEWRLHPQVVDLLWQRFGRAEVDLFALNMTTHCPLRFFLSSPSPLGLDALAHKWLRTNLYAFPPIRLLPAVLFRIRSERVEHLLLVAPWWPTQSWFSDLVSLLAGPPWEVPLRHDLLMQAWGMIWHPRPELWKLWAWPLSGVR
ncbi:uncharacterized protein [Sinocyclocheilus grahami]|uniref:uncharacterized protein n=1 Tax=Sinocyclocheilus grahami TaxID=75366 RepID=UPI0007ACA17D|nr:PREDICTED: uncharacterized protein LOC107602589 [Sinocyclocheilus grahami]